MEDFFWSHWYYNVPNYLAAAIMYTLLARFFLQFFVPPSWPNYIWQWFLNITNWAVAATRFVTPSVMSFIWLPLFGALWLFFLRLAFTLTMARYGLAPTLQ
jgi:hypothetical protein